MHKSRQPDSVGLIVGIEDNSQINRNADSDPDSGNDCYLCQPTKILFEMVNLGVWNYDRFTCAIKAKRNVLRIDVLYMTSVGFTASHARKHMVASAEGNGDAMSCD